MSLAARGDGPRIVLIGGPTASGKSALAQTRAERENGVVINADAMQVYAGLPILTAQPPAADQARVPHLLYSFVDPAERFSVGKWLDRARACVREVLASGRKPFLVGGTGLYFRAFLEGLAAIPPIPDSVREEARNLYDRLGSEGFRRELERLDPGAAARLQPNDRQRLLRAWEVARHTGKTLEAWQRESGTEAEGCSDAVERQLLLPPRAALYAACDHRFDGMVAQGAIEEVRALLARNLDPDLPAMKILGVRELADAVRGASSLEEACAKARQRTRNYAKRQTTWFRHQWSAQAT